MRRMDWPALAGLIGIFLLSGAMPLHAQVRINELLAVNSTVLADEDGDYPDWIELYNAGAQEVSLGSWRLSDDSTGTGWIFPDVAIGPGQYLLVFASGKDKAVPGGELHTNFRISGGGEYLALLDASAQVVSAFDPGFPPQQEDISYGYLQGAFLNFSTPSPGSANLEEQVILSLPGFDPPHGMYRDSVVLEISSDYPGAEVYYTLDGTAPTLEEGFLYEGPLTLRKNTIVRAATVVDNAEIGAASTSSYIFPASVLSQGNKPAGYPDAWGPYTAIEGTSVADYEMDPEMLADPAYREEVEEALWSLPSVSLVTERGFLFSHEQDPDRGGIYIYTGPPITRTTYGYGRGWERPASMEFFDGTGSKSLQVDCGIRLHGGHSRRPEKCPKHSFRVVFKDEYGPTRLHYPLFSDEDATTNFNVLVLRAGFGLSWVHWNHVERRQAQYIQDIWAKDAQRALGHPSSHSEFVHLYLNGIYWGIYALSENLDKDFADAYLDGGEADFDIIKDYQDVVDGSIDSWNRLHQKANAGLAENAAYQEIQGRNPSGVPDPGLENLVDVESLMDYMLINFYGGNTDWDHHNWVSINNREDASTGFRFFCWDSEHLLKSLDENVVEENNADCPSRIFQQLRENEEFRLRFADRAHELCTGNGILATGPAAARWEERSQTMEPAIRAEATRWGDYRRDVHPFNASGPFDLYDYEHYWLDQRHFLTGSYFPQRSSILLDQLRSAGLYPELDPPVLSLNGAPYGGETPSRGDLLGMQSDQGLIYYTLNGQDPADLNREDEGSIELVPEGADKFVLVPSSDLGEDWFREADYDHSQWTLVRGLPGGIGYEQETGYEDLLSLDLSMRMYAGGEDPNSSCYVRIPFTLDANTPLDDKRLLLHMQFDDGFAAFLNGVRVAEVNAPLGLGWDAMASSGHEHEFTEVFDLSAHLDLLVEGDNLLAIQGMNTSTTSSDFIVNAWLSLNDAASAPVSEDALLYTEAFPLDRSASVVARAWLNGSWSAATKAGFSFTEDLDDIRITEIHYEPMAGVEGDGADFEFVEIKNVGDATLDLGGVAFVEGIGYTFPAGTQLPPGQFKVLASSPSHFAARYGFYPSGQYSGQLNNAGEFLRLQGPSSDTLFRILYDDAAPWPSGEANPGHSVVPVELDPPASQGSGTLWRHSHHPGGSPMKDDLDLTGAEKESLTASAWSLGQNYPNPFSDVSWFSFVLDEESRVELGVYSLTGQKLAVLLSGRRPAGQHIQSWNGHADGAGRLNPGIYLYRLETSGASGSRSMTRKFIIQ